ncbi:hypothetical protein D9M72_582050 [compost metagenome]
MTSLTASNWSIRTTTGAVRAKVSISPSKWPRNPSASDTSLSVLTWVGRRSALMAKTTTPCDCRRSTSSANSADFPEPDSPMTRVQA